MLVFLLPQPWYPEHPSHKNVKVFKTLQYCRGLHPAMQKKRSKDDSRICINQLYFHRRRSNGHWNMGYYCRWVQKRSKHQRLGASFCTLHPQFVLDIQLCAIQTKRQYEAVQLRKSHLGQKTECFILLWKATQSRGVQVRFVTCRP